MAARSWSTRRAAYELLSTIWLAAAIFMAWKALALVTDCPAPIVVVTSESMEPAFQRGDILFLWNRQTYAKIGDIAVLSFPSRKVPMVHRVIRTHILPKADESGVSDGTSTSFNQYILTKGDNNDADDALLYPNDQGLASRDNVIGFVRVYVPFLGWPVIKMNELLSRPTRYVM